MKILMVCLGNICRSPLAHGILKQKVKDKQLNWIVESAGTGDWHIGEAPDRRAISIAKKYGVDISGQRARHFQPAFFEEYDLIFVMDRQNFADVCAQAANKADLEKVQLFLADDIVPDPYFDDNLFDPVFQMIDKRCMEVIETMSKKKE
ncbi:low molecular weight protein-tyrosine-phosphatase [Sphingobacterium athyrii]|uniref:protein-tyrosine-phosphatase n=1 Tax=Sphingobacterium athyrii TaxID=2152717 RepID=A0A363NRT7_9SPHI|nr:low molecular weight protein-tyrosine-phosphatase [Sphingobacterium athyrii]PUV23430.1 protein tyrosine phosphatase [Sphingobacterium athyrii]